MVILFLFFSNSVSLFSPSHLTNMPEGDGKMQWCRSGHWSYSKETVFQKTITS